MLFPGFGVVRHRLPHQPVEETLDAPPCLLGAQREPRLAVLHTPDASQTQTASAPQLRTACLARLRASGLVAVVNLSRFDRITASADQAPLPTPRQHRAC
jgi:hypothetical protein